MENRILTLVYIIHKTSFPNVANTPQKTILISRRPQILVIQCELFVYSFAEVKSKILQMKLNAICVQSH